MRKFSKTGLRTGAKKLSSRLLIVLLAAGVVAFVGVFLLESIQIKQMQAQYAQKKLDMAAVQERNDRLQQHLDFYNGPGYMLYVEKVAREALGLSKPGETVILAVPDKTVTQSAVSKPKAEIQSQTSQTDKKASWQNWFGFFFGK